VARIQAGTRVRKQPAVLPTRSRREATGRGAVAAALIGAVALLAVSGLIGLSGALVLAVVAAAAALDRVMMTLRARRRKNPSTRLAVIGDAAVAERLRRDLEDEQRRYRYIGRIALPGADADDEAALAPLAQLREALIEHRVELLVLAPDAPREAVFAELVSRCLDLHFQVVELAAAYESAFGYVPISEMNAVWFQYLVDPSWRFPHPLAKRTIDLLAITLLAIPALPLCALLILLIRRDGGPGTFRQERIGEGGRRFTLYKLRTMLPSSDTRAQWAAINDGRVTRIGRFLRSTHFDELPQLLNVLRGEMSLVGPRPEQPAIVEHLEREVPFYQRRHLVRPGITGWAQIRCGYARSDSGSVWKHCHDLYYLKHRSVRLDFQILAETARLILVGAIRRREVIASSEPPDETLAASEAAAQPAARFVITTAGTPRRLVYSPSRGEKSRLG
jgi:exopolysaccharide biosynthesis polyprenyl glycosylphosphotransferase